jgi:hypothetical protein
MEPMLMLAVGLSCMVAVGAGIYVAIQGSKMKDQDKEEE